MARPFKSQWDTNELFPTEEIRKVLTVSELTGSIRRVLEKEVGSIWVSGELSNVKAQSSGHVYFSLKDAGAQLGCVMFRTEAVNVPREFFQDGQKVILHGQVTVYEPRGQYQLRVLTLEIRGIGALQAAFEKLKLKLQEEGLFDTSRKRTLPHYPARIGIVTSTTGAAIRDVLHVLGRRAPCMEIVIANCRVQGSGAASEIACSINWLNEWSSRETANRLDLILVTRGGGSLEDLWAFNEETVARAIFNSKLPVVSAVGHEIDFTISDFVADLRAATPSAAAEIISEGFHSSREFITEAAMRLRSSLEEHLEWKRQEVRNVFHRLRQLHPRRKLDTQVQRVDELTADFQRCFTQQLRRKAESLEESRERLSHMDLQGVLRDRQERLQVVALRLRKVLRQKVGDWGAQVNRQARHLRLLSPTSVLERGYSITTDASTSAIIRDASQVEVGQVLKTRLSAGEIESVVERKK